jgi:hypothetical protein
MLRPKGPFCPSCGMPLSEDPVGGGRFTEPDISVDEMMTKVG